jgi:pimeloyl-ACP methyl ester carboxylesterase
MSQPTDIFIPSPDGLKLHARWYGPDDPATLPVVCLPGLTRTTVDFEFLALSLANRGRRVIAIDYRGRGLSDYDPNPANYNVGVELTDLVTVLAALHIARAIFIGTSRGGILAMMLASVRPDLIAGVILNDIGPVIELEGLMRIKSYVGKMPEPRDHNEAAAILRTLFGAQFPKLTDAHWQISAQRSFKQENGRLVPTYDPQLARGLDTVNPEIPLAPMWPQFDMLTHVPLMVIRGALSDILSVATVEQMKIRHPSLQIVEVPDEGHAPLLIDPPTIGRIEAFIDRVDSIASISGT